jgi:hypothetical protein
METTMHTLSLLPEEIMEHICRASQHDQTKYVMKEKDRFAIPFTIAPLFTKYCTNETPLDACVMNPLPKTNVLTNVQYWHNEHRLSEDILRTDNVYKKDVGNCSSIIFDGINQNNIAVSVYKYANYEPQARYVLYVMKQTKKRGKRKIHQECNPLITGTGTLTSLLLEYERNRIVYSVDMNQRAQHRLCIQDIGTDCNLDYCSLEFTLPFLFTKTACIGNNMYLGITPAGDVYSFWLTENNTIEYAQQKFANGKKCVDISVDITSRTDQGLYKKIAFLTTTGDIFITSLGAFAQPTLFYLTTIADHFIKRLYYRDGKISIVYTHQKDVITIEDNCALLYFRALCRRILYS